MNFSRDAININPQNETEKIITKISEDVRKLKKKGAVVGISGGIDSAVVMALCVKALGSERVLALMLPEKESDPENFILGRKLANKFNVKYHIEDLTAALSGFGCYTRRDNAVRRIFPEYDSSYKMKIVLPQNILKTDLLNLFSLKIISPEGEEKAERLHIKEYLDIVAASNFKQRSRMTMLYYYGETLNFAVAGTPNKNEHQQGFFVKYGDSGADIKPIVHLFKTQVYQLAEYLDIPEEIQSREPTTDTYTANQTQEEFFFRLPFELLDRIWFGWENGITSAEIAEKLNLNTEQVQNVINDIQRKIKTTEYLRQEAL